MVFMCLFCDSVTIKRDYLFIHCSKICFSLKAAEMI